MLAAVSTAWGQTAVDLANGQVVGNLAFRKNGYAYYHINVPPGRTRLTIGMTGGVGDADLYARMGALPNGRQFDGRSIRPGNTEWLQFRNPAPGEWYILIFAKTAVAGAKVWAIYEGPPIAGVAAPVITPAGGTFTGAVAVTVACPTAGAEIRMTTDGSDPTSASPLYAPFQLNQIATVKARAFLGEQTSPVASATFTCATVAPPPRRGSASSIWSAERC